MNIRIIEERFGINRRTGERSAVLTDDRTFPAIHGTVMEMPVGKRNFYVDGADENSVTVTVRYEKNPSANATWNIPAGESIIYRPRSMDGGYKYTVCYTE